jgi:hypothetical protein
MFKFQVWEGLYVSWLPVDRVESEGNTTVDWDYLVDLPTAKSGYKHVVELVEAPWDTDVLEDEFVLIADT